MGPAVREKLSENLKQLEKFQVAFQKKKSISELLRKFFKSMHEILYEIENRKKEELEYVIQTTNSKGKAGDMPTTIRKQVPDEVFSNILNFSVSELDTEMLKIVEKFVDFEKLKLFSK